MNVPCFITARLGSTRLPQKHLLKLGELTVIEHIVRRCEHFGFTPYICVPEGERETFADHTSCLDVYEGDPENIEARLIGASIYYKQPQFHHLDGDDPFFSCEAVLESFQWLFRGKFSHVLPSISSQSGTGLVGTSYNTSAPAGSTKYILPDSEGSPWPQRLTLDYPEDYHLILAVNRMVGGYMAPRWAVDQLFIDNPDLHKINWFRTNDWKDRQRYEQRH